ncbi:MAG: nucleotidyltransferase domain-containing protein, partial [Candidatus Omnitrophica bacterium]|nr:nucleotidyltransferase domain-containing protein [Candidatus Omnitrophota bacterium]
MGKKDVLNILKRLSELLEHSNVHVERLILFGSWARGTQQEGSDIDVVIVSSDFTGKDYWTRINILSEAIYK